MSWIRRKCFISYHHADQREVNRFISHFDNGHDVFIARGLGQEMTPDVIESTDTTYVMRRIRDLYLPDSTVTIVLLGRCTWARRYVDWEIQASLRHGETVTANGLLGIKLPSFPHGGQFPNRLNLHLKQSQHQADCYARTLSWPCSTERLAAAIESAFLRRQTHCSWIRNPRERMKYNRTCE